MEQIYQNEQYRFYLVFHGNMGNVERQKAAGTETEVSGNSPARMQVIRENAAGSAVILMEYTFPAQLIPEVHVKEKGKLIKEPGGGSRISAADPDSEGREEQGKAGNLAETVLTFSLHLEVHHVSGMVQGEFVEDESYEVRNPFAEAGEAAGTDADGKESEVSDSGENGASNVKENGLSCSVTDIVRKTRFAAAPRHLEHVPKRTYPPVDGKQGPYGHPSIRTLPPIPKRKHVEQRSN